MMGVTYQEWIPAEARSGSTETKSAEIGETPTLTTNTNTDANTNMCTNTNIKRSTCLENHREQGTLFDQLEVQLVFCTY